MAYRANLLRLVFVPLLLVLSPSFAPPLERPATTGIRLVLPTVPLGPAPSDGTPEDRERARQINEAIPFARQPGPQAVPFIMAGDESSRQRAIDCLATVMWYEAGPDAAGQRAVGQVVLNRVRHPAFPPSVCGAAFEGSSLPTGCQFTFTCDGSMRHRRPTEAQFTRARELAGAMLTGMTDPRVGLATHYHTDWVHPDWSGSMLKLARVGTHLFFRWKGAGRVSALDQDYSANEPLIGSLAVLSSAHSENGEVAGGAAAALIEPAVLEIGTTVTGRETPASATGRTGLYLTVSPADGAAAPALAALELCGSRPSCKVLGLPSDGAEVVFVYVRDRRTGVERTIWDCSRFSRRNAEQCLGPKTRQWIAFEGSLSTSPAG